jgi:hypothetical protein
MVLTYTKHWFADYWTGHIQNYQSTNTGTYPVVHNDWPIHPELTVHQKQHGLCGNSKDWCAENKVGSIFGDFPATISGNDPLGSNKQRGIDWLCNNIGYYQSTNSGMDSVVCH